MPKYAIVVTADARFIAGVNGMLNAMRYYEMEDIEFHLVHTFPEKDGYIEKAKATFPFLKAIDLRKYAVETGHWDGTKISKSLMKYVRWWYPVDRLSDYDAICILDADRQIVNNLRPFFHMIARSDMIGLAKNDWSDAEWDTYDGKRAMQAQPPLYSNPYFITGPRAKELFPLIPEYAENPQKYSKHTKKTQTGDMHPVNLTLLDTGMIKDVIPLSGSQWVFVNTTHVNLHRRIVNGKQYIGMHKTGDLLYTYHRHWESQRDCIRYMNGRTPDQRANGCNNTRLFWEFTRFFNLDLYLKIDWIWGDFPVKEYAPPKAERETAIDMRNYLLKGRRAGWFVGGDEHVDIVTGRLMKMAREMRVYKEK